MRRSLFIVAASMLTASVPGYSATPLSAPAQHDVQCFILYMLAMGSAVEEKDGKSQKAASLGLMYFVGKLTIEAPGVDLADAIRQEENGILGTPRAKDIGTACDAEFFKRSNDLIAMQKKL